VSAVEVVALTGGIGGAKLALGLHRVLPPGALACIVNTGDDFVHLGLHVSPDLDTTLYTLAGCENPEQGWGRRDETWTFMRVLEELGGETWFRLGDGDLALHVERTRRLAAGETLSAIMDDIRRRFGIASRLLPMSDDTVATRVHTPDAELPFQFGDVFGNRGLANTQFLRSAGERPAAHIRCKCPQPCPKLHNSRLYHLRELCIFILTSSGFG